MPAQVKRPTSSKVGFIACYKGRDIAYAGDLKELMGKAKVQALLGNKDLLIKHTIPESLIAIY